MRTRSADAEMSPRSPSPFASAANFFMRNELAKLIPILALELVH